MRQLFFRVLLVLVALLAGYAAGCASGGGQPHMQSALSHLQSAHHELDVAVSDKGGHRTRAMSLIDDAIAEVHAGIDYAGSH